MINILNFEGEAVEAGKVELGLGDKEVKVSRRRKKILKRLQRWVKQGARMCVEGLNSAL